MTKNLLIAYTMLLMAAVLGTTCSTAAEPAPWGPALGTTLDPGLAATHHGEPVRLEDLSGEAGLAIAFVRSADWCRFCKKQLIHLSQREAEFRERGLQLVALSYDSTDLLSGFAAEFDIGYPLLSDPESKVIDAFGIRNTKHKAGSSSYGIPHPGIVVYDADGVLIAKFAEMSYRKRPEIDDILAGVDAVQPR